MSAGPSVVGPRHPASAGTWSATGSSRRNVPSATSRISAAPVKDFVIEAMRKTVSASGGGASVVVDPAVQDERVVAHQPPRHRGGVLVARPAFEDRVERSVDPVHRRGAYRRPGHSPQKAPVRPASRKYAAASAGSRRR